MLKKNLNKFNLLFIISLLLNGIFSIMLYDSQKKIGELEKIYQLISDIKIGEKIFKSKCEKCHDFQYKLIGPSFISMYGAGKDFKANDTIEMHNELNLSIKEVQQINDYIKNKLKVKIK